MTTIELKNKLKQKIDELDEDYLLEELLNIINLETSNTELFIIPDQHKKALEASLSQMDAGKTTSHAEVMKSLSDGFGS